MRLLTEAAGQVLTRNVVADRRRRSRPRPATSNLADVEEEPRLRSMPMPMAIPAENQPPKVLGPRTRRTWLTSAS